MPTELASATICPRLRRARQTQYDRVGTDQPEAPELTAALLLGRDPAHRYAVGDLRPHQLDADIDGCSAVRCAHLDLLLRQP